VKQRRLAFWSWLNHWPWKRRGPEGEEWTVRRFALWKRTALRSLQDQSVTDWRYALICSPEQRELTRFFEVDDKRVTIVHGGEERSWRARLPGAPVYVVARLDSDDRYHPDAGSLLLRPTSGRAGSWLQFNSGYAWDEEAARLYAWDQPSSPFYAQVVKGNEFRRAIRVPRPRHTEPVLSGARRLAPGRFVVTLHGANTSTSLRTGTLGREILGERKEAVVEAFGLLR
jgi:hypothetical protein